MVEQTQFEADLTKKLQTGTLAQDNGEVGGAIKMFEEVIRQEAPTEEDLTEAAIKAKEQATYKLGEIYREKSLIEELVKLTKNILPLFINFPKSKLGRIIRTLFDLAIRVKGK